VGQLALTLAPLGHIPLLEFTPVPTLDPKANTAALEIRALLDELRADGVDHLGRKLPPSDRPRVVAPEQAGDPDQRLGLRLAAARREPCHVGLPGDRVPGGNAATRAAARAMRRCHGAGPWGGGASGAVTEKKHSHRSASKETRRSPGPSCRS